jgi:hypothetical protein
LIQRQQLASLRVEQQGLITRLRTSQYASYPVGMVTYDTAVSHSIAAPSLELLRLRSEVTRLTERRRELAATRGENERLRAQLVASRTNASATNTLPPGYVRKSQARFVGYNTPADTIQSVLWAIRNGNFTNVMEAFTPEEARQMRVEAYGTAEEVVQMRQGFHRSSGADEFFSHALTAPGMCIKSQQQFPDGSLELEVEMLPGLLVRTHFRQINGQWKLGSR